MKRFGRLLLVVTLTMGASGLAWARPLRLGVEQAIAQAIKANVRTRIARERVREAEGAVAVAYAKLLPSLSFSTSQANRTVNLKSQGFNLPGFPIPSVIGPFYSFDSRVTLIYKLYDPQNHWGLRSSTITRRVRKLQVTLARRTVTALTAASYVDLLQANQKVNAGQADVAVAQRLLRKARHLEQAGVAAGVDVTRAETRLTEQQLRLIQDQQDSSSSRRDLLRLMGVPLTTVVEPTDRLALLPNPYPGPNRTVKMALRHRLEMIIARTQTRLALAQVHYAEAGNAVTVNLEADAGYSGVTPSQSDFFTHDVGVQLNWPLFDGGETDGKIEEAKSRLAQAKTLLDDTRAQVDKDVRDAWSVVTTGRASLVSANQALKLSKQELKMSEDRFAAGVTNNVEVLEAQAALSRARYNRVKALAAYNLGLVQLASASGRPSLLLRAYHDSLPQEKRTSR